MHNNGSANTLTPLNRALAMSRPCCSRWHDRDCYHCGHTGPVPGVILRGRCYCTDAQIAEQERQDLEVYTEAMRCWCGGCEAEDDEGNPYQPNPAPCALHRYNEMAAHDDEREGELLW